MQRDYEITITIDGRPRSGRWMLRQGGKVRVTCIWGVHTVDCAPPARPEVAAGEALAEIYRAFHREQAELAERTAREVAAVDSYWDQESKKRPGPEPEAQGRVDKRKVRRRAAPANPDQGASPKARP